MIIYCVEMGLSPLRYWLFLTSVDCLPEIDSEDGLYLSASLTSLSDFKSTKVERVWDAVALPAVDSSSPNELFLLMQKGDDVFLSSACMSLLMVSLPRRIFVNFTLGLFLYISSSEWPSESIMKELLLDKIIYVGVLPNLSRSNDS